jgi:hypothetical protein
MALNDSTTGTSTSRTVVGIFHDRADAESAIGDLKLAGFSNEQIGVAMRDRDTQKELTEELGPGAAEGAATGAISGGIVGGLLGLLGSLLIPGVGPIVAGGVLASALVGAGAGAATGGIIGALVGMGISEEEATHFDTLFREGGILVTVNAGNRTDQALNILQRRGADLGPLRTAARQRAVAGRFAGAPSPGEVRIEWEEAIEVRSPGDVTARPGGSAGHPVYSGRERRRNRDASYAGPERRQAML